MRKCFGPIVLSLVLGLAMVGNAAAEIKIGFVNAPAILEKAPQATSASAALQKEFEPREREIVSMTEAVRKMEERMARDADIMSDAGRRDLDRDIRAKRRDIERAKQEFREDLALRRNEMLANLQRVIRESIKNIASDEGFDVVMGEGVVYASKRVNITDKVLERLRKEFQGANP